jgi:hypothetical protein
VLGQIRKAHPHVAVSGSGGSTIGAEEPVLPGKDRSEVPGLIGKFLGVMDVVDIGRYEDSPHKLINPERNNDVGVLKDIFAATSAWTGNCSANRRRYRRPRFVSPQETVKEVSSHTGDLRLTRGAWNRILWRGARVGLINWLGRH